MAQRDVDLTDSKDNEGPTAYRIPENLPLFYEYPGSNDRQTQRGFDQDCGCRLLSQRSWLLVATLRARCVALYP